MSILFNNAFLLVLCLAFLVMTSAGLIEFRVKAETPAFDKSNFPDPLKIDNKYYPLKPGTIMSYNGTDEDGKPVRDIVTVTNDTKEVQGIATRVVNDTVFAKGKLEETTNDWYAQDGKGNVWYMGEDTTDLTEKKNPHAGSWESGVKGAKAGLIMLAEPKVGITYDQEFAQR